MRVISVKKSATTDQWSSPSLIHRQTTFCNDKMPTMQQLTKNQLPLGLNAHIHKQAHITTIIQYPL